ncbi:hypothetical protein R1flu_010257 [Riccia fluitans]|uniref:LAGLIDADG homing endonuclease n=1 Tax=Riccia fluitans TaxID=41844 RepID=A0ABD1Z4M1_9MARC
MVNYINRVMTAIECCLKNEISWPNRLERTRIAFVFATGGFPGCIGLVDGTTIRLSQRPAEDGETYFDRKVGVAAEIQRYSDRYKLTVQTKRPPLSSVLKLAPAYFPAELLGEGAYRYMRLYL